MGPYVAHAYNHQKVQPLGPGEAFLAKRNSLSSPCEHRRTSSLERGVKSCSGSNPRGPGLESRAPCGYVLMCPEIGQRDRSRTDTGSRGESELLQPRELSFGKFSVAAAGRPGRSSEGIVQGGGSGSGDGPDQQRMTVEGTIKN